MSIGAIWDLVILSPMINIVIVLSHYLFNSFGLTIIVLTIIIRAVMYPLTLKQLHATKAMQSIQAEMAELQKKYAKDKRKLAQEQLALYKKSGMNPAGCLLPMLLQMPVWIALYQSIIRVLAVAPEDFLNLSKHLYTSWPMVFTQVPLESRFLWLDLAVPDRWMLLPILVGGTMWVQQKMTTMPTTDPKAQSQAQMMLWMMPLMFAFLTIQFPSGLALYWIASNVISIAMQYMVTGWGGLLPTKAGKRVASDKKIPGQTAQPKAIAEPDSAQGGEVDNGKSGDESQDSGGSNPTRPGTAKPKPGGGRGQHPRRR